jgi:hypothetical protein
VWLISDSAVVSPLSFEPAVLDTQGEDWIGLSTEYSRTPEADVVPLAADGPASWERVAPGEFPSPRKLPAARISRVEVDRAEVSFRVSRTGVPTVVRVSWFPGWKVEGADGPYRVTPNLMVVVPTSSEVRLHRGRTAPEWLGIASGLAGIGAVISLGLNDRRRRRALPPPPWPAPRTRPGQRRKPVRRR